ncbi:D(2) dopamine receptor A-like [Dendronephthya gigantea]|uniref:D(2) dopamine receptor A-like n=1 Tax=Dendronephthya gigantea TaxID=151771 RepID=UPI00106D24A5|nr:D(2) dopamine receptor A-like [Dendronephthya gigantea]
MRLSNISEFVAANQSNQTSFKTEKNELWYTRAVLTILIIILSTLGNLMVLAAMWIEKRFRQPNKYFIACLASADLLNAVFYNPFVLYEHISETGITSIHLCRFFMWINIFAESASINTLTWISYDRYLKISKPLQYNVLMTTQKSLIVITIIWTISTAYGTFGMFAYSGSRGIYISSQGCAIQNPIFFTVSAISAFFLPTVITLIMYTRILFIAHRRRKRANVFLGEYHVKNHRNSLHEDIRNIRMMAIVVGAFIFCWGPFFVLTFFSVNKVRPLEYALEYDIIVVVTRHILPPLNSICNPIIYACFDQKYREAFKHLVNRILCR